MWLRLGQCTYTTQQSNKGNGGFLLVLSSNSTLQSRLIDLQPDSPAYILLFLLILVQPALQPGNIKDMDTTLTAARKALMKPASTTAAAVVMTILAFYSACNLWD